MVRTSRPHSPVWGRWGLFTSSLFSLTFRTKHPITAKKYGSAEEQKLFLPRKIGWILLNCRIPHWDLRLTRWFSGKESSCNAGDKGSIPELGRSPNGNPLQYACEILWIEGPGGLQSMRSQRVRHDWVHTHTLRLKPINSNFQQGAHLLNHYHCLNREMFAAFYFRLWNSMAQRVKHLSTMWKTQVRSLGQKDPLEKGMAIHSSTITWRIPWTEEPGRLQSIGSQRVGHDWATSLTSLTQLILTLCQTLC